MACMEWTCSNEKCGNVIFNNDSKGQPCNACGSSMTGHFDEMPGSYYNEEDPVEPLEEGQ